MDTSSEISDPTQWLETPLSLLAPLESALRCQVCKEFFNNPVITSCCHTFCSLCIRRCLSAEGKCPACRSPDQELKLRRNWAVQELVDAFQTARPSVLDFSRETTQLAQAEEQAGEPLHKKRKVTQVEEHVQTSETSSQGRRTRSQRHQLQAEESPAFDTSPQVIEDSQDEDEYVPDDGLVACPICNRKMKEEAVFPHLNVHQEGESPKKPPPAPSSFGSLRAPPKSLVLSGKPVERIPAINYSILKENALRKKLSDLGIPNWGPKQLLHRRHTEWMNLWNANCDSKIPKSKRELLQELDVWERTQGGLAAGPSPFVSNSNVMRKDFDAKEWSSSHDDDFKRLIANARKKAGVKANPATSESVPVPPPSEPPVNSSLVEPSLEAEPDQVIDLSG
ncbi:DNA repair protein (RadR) [Penicillium brevicompactum]|uniref:Postreplication repair E3 ubiquitin-protein ligase RAD18 n=1 Tax=Penicillium brevicompactum TaxID=5074 RepID=A0A9W9RYU9_PENBR|nr:DNA repair protein (RadR) [Penicillium brevicompactum]